MPKKLSRLARGKPSYKKDVGLFQGIINAMHAPFRKELKQVIKKEHTAKW